MRNKACRGRGRGPGPEKRARLERGQGIAIFYTGRKRGAKPVKKKVLFARPARPVKSTFFVGSKAAKGAATG
ncbi:hypothetical protein CE91St44_09350 [Oscillospiraceae bacterium]|nr:hypothetical protein CE91St44_09350 [Oscillospiraceae bacterium]